MSLMTDIFFPPGNVCQHVRNIIYFHIQLTDSLHVEFQLSDFMLLEI
jgi:hypothetical protein